MINLEKEQYRTVGLGVAAASFLMLLIGIKGVLGNEVNIRNMAAFFSFSVLAGIISSCMVYYSFKIALALFSAGLVIGFFEMFRAFLGKMSSWGDLIGILSLFVWAAMGLGAAVLVQLGYYLYSRFKKNVEPEQSIEKGDG